MFSGTFQVLYYVNAHVIFKEGVEDTHWYFILKTKPARMNIS